MPAEGGPWILIATFCRDVTGDAQHGLSIEHLIGRLMFDTNDPAATEIMPEITHTLTLVVSIVPAPGQTTANLTLGIQSPDGRRGRGSPMPIEFLPKLAAMTTIVPMQLRFHMEGLHFAEVYVDEQMLTRVPLEVVYVQRPATTTRSP